MVIQVFGLLTLQLPVPPVTLTLSLAALAAYEALVDESE